MSTLADKIRLLKPGAKFCVWETLDRSLYFGEKEPIEFLGCLIDWKEGYTLPTEAEVLAMTDEDEVAITAMKENERKDARDLNAKSDMALMAQYMIHKKAKGASLRDFLDELEEFSKSVD